jgi:hypothetical protein
MEFVVLASIPVVGVFAVLGIAFNLYQKIDGEG